MPKQPQIMPGVDAAAGDAGGEIACGRPGERNTECGVKQHCYAMLAPGQNQRGSIEPAPGQRSCYLYHIKSDRGYDSLLDEGRRTKAAERRHSSFVVLRDANIPGGFQ